MPSETRTIVLRHTVWALKEWYQIHSRDYPEGRNYKGNVTHEDVAYALDPLTVLTTQDLERYAREDVPKQLEAQFRDQGVTLLRLKVYTGVFPSGILGIPRPSIRVESWQPSSSLVLVLALVIGVLALLWAFLAWLFQKAEEIEWLAPAIGAGLIILLLFGLVALGKRRKGKRK